MMNSSDLDLVNQEENINILHIPLSIFDSSISFEHPLYHKLILNDVKEINIKNTKIFDVLPSYLDLSRKHPLNDLVDNKNIKFNIEIKMKIIFWNNSREYVYELWHTEDLYPYNENKINDDNDDIIIEYYNSIENKLAGLLTNNEIIYGPVIIVKNKIDILTKKHSITSIRKEEIEDLLYKRYHHKYCFYDDQDSKWKEGSHKGNQDNIYTILFNDNNYKKKQINFMNLYQLIVLYSKDENCFNLLNPTTCIIYSAIDGSNIIDLELDILSRIIYLIKNNITTIPKNIEDYSKDEKFHLTSYQILMMIDVS